MAIANKTAKGLADPNRVGGAVPVQYGNKTYEVPKAYGGLFQGGQFNADAFNAMSPALQAGVGGNIIGNIMRQGANNQPFANWMQQATTGNAAASPGFARAPSTGISGMVSPLRVTKANPGAGAALGGNPNAGGASSFGPTTTGNMTSMPGRAISDNFPGALGPGTVSGMSPFTSNLIYGNLGQAGSGTGQGSPFASSIAQLMQQMGTGFGGGGGGFQSPMYGGGFDTSGNQEGLFYPGGSSTFNEAAGPNQAAYGNLQSALGSYGQQSNTPNAAGGYQSPATRAQIGIPRLASMMPRGMY